MKKNGHEGLTFEIGSANLPIITVQTLWMDYEGSKENLNLPYALKYCKTPYSRYYPWKGNYGATARKSVSSLVRNIRTK